MTTSNNLERAKRLLGPNMPILSGDGRWCVRTPMGAYLFDTKDEAERSFPNPDRRYVRVFDVGPEVDMAEVLARMPDRFAGRD